MLAAIKGGKLHLVPERWTQTPIFVHSVSQIGGQIESLCEANLGRGGLEFTVELPIILADGTISVSNFSIVEDRAFRHKARVENRRRLEDEWQRAAEVKRARELQDRLLGLEAGQLLHEQCDKYKHCQQCKRRMDNCGESNIWRESRYIPGSRIMV